MYRSIYIILSFLCFNATASCICNVFKKSYFKFTIKISIHQFGESLKKWQIRLSACQSHWCPCTSIAPCILYSNCCSLLCHACPSRCLTSFLCWLPCCAPSPLWTSSLGRQGNKFPSFPKPRLSFQQFSTRINHDSIYLQSRTGYLTESLL